MTDKAELTKAGTMVLTAKDGKAFLDKNLTDWKKPGLMGHFDEKGEANNPDEKKGAKGKKGAPAKKGRMAKAGTMVATAKEGNDLLGGEKLGDTRQVTKKKPAATKGTTKRVNTMARVVEEAKAICGSSINASEGRKLRKRAAPPPSAMKPKKAKKAPLKKGRTMVNTAKEGKAFLKKEGHPDV